MFHDYNLERDFKKAFEGLARETQHNPQTAIKEREEEIEIKIVAPESSKENFEIEIKDGLLTVGHTVIKETELRRNFESKFVLGRYAVLRIGSATASYKEGVLTISIPKIKPTQIPVK